MCRSGCPQRGDKRTLQETVARNAAQALIAAQDQARQRPHHPQPGAEEIQEALDLDEAPLRIECYDISNLQGTEVVASMVVFEDGLARKSEYRRFVIRGVDGQNDVASMHEVITRRFRRLLDEQAPSTEIGHRGRARCWSTPRPARPRKFAYAPGLVVVDGGPPQVAAAQPARWRELGIDDIPVCGLAKRLEEVWLPDQEDPVILPRTSEGLYLLQRVRDEAHRFAITHHRSGAVQVDGREPARRRARARRGAPQDPAQALRLAEEAARRRTSTRSPRCRASARELASNDRRGPRGTGRGGGEPDHRRACWTASTEQWRTHERRPPQRLRFVVVTGMTGAGRSTAAKELEDLGFYVVDNLPPHAAARGLAQVDESVAPPSRSRSWSTSAPGRSSSSSRPPSTHLGQARRRSR